MQREANMFPGKLLLRHQRVQSSLLSRYSHLLYLSLSNANVYVFPFAILFLLGLHLLLKNVASGS